MCQFGSSSSCMPLITPMRQTISQCQTVFSSVSASSCTLKICELQIGFLCIKITLQIHFHFQFFRLYFGIKPVFVFDGATPSIKKKTLMIRRKLRHKQQVNYGKAAEKLLHNIVKETLIKQIQSKKRGSDEQTPSIEQQNSGSNLQEEEESDQEEDNQSNPLLTKLLIDKHRSLLEQNEIDIEIFQSMDIEEQYEVIEELQRMHRDVVRERIAAVQSDLVEFSQMQMSTFIDGIKEKKRQKDIMIKASEAELRATHGEQQQLNGNNLRLIYMNKQDSNLQQYLPKTVLDIIDKAKKRRGNGIFRGKGKNDIEALIARNALEQQDQALIDDVFNKNPITFIKIFTNNLLVYIKSYHLQSNFLQLQIIISRTKLIQIMQAMAQKYLRLRQKLIKKSKTKGWMISWRAYLGTSGILRESPRVKLMTGLQLQWCFHQGRLKLLKANRRQRELSQRVWNRSRNTVVVIVQVDYI